MDQPSTTSSSSADELSSLLRWINSTDGLQGWTTDGLTTTLDGLQGWTATTDGLDDGLSTAASALDDGPSTSASALDDGPSTSASALDDGPSTSASLDDELSTASALLSLQGSIAASALDDELTTVSALLSLQGSPTASTQDDEPSHSPNTLPTLNLPGLSDILNNLTAALEDYAAPKTSNNKGSSLSDQLQEEPGLFETLKELGFQETATGKSCCHMQ